MVADSVVQGLRLWAGGRGGKPTGREADLAEIVRARLNGKVEHGDLASSQRTRLAHGLSPLVSHWIEALGEKAVKRLGHAELGEVIFEAFEIIATRTRLLTRYQAILDSES